MLWLSACAMGDFDGPAACPPVVKYTKVDQVRAAIEVEALPEELRVAITLREMDGLSYEEIAEAMDCPIGTVRSRIFRAREAISARVKPLLSHQTGKRW